MKTILVVEDEYDLLSTLRAILEGEGYATQACSDGQEALERLRSRRPDLLLIDLMLPRVSGEEVARIVGSSPELAGLPVVMMSAMPTSGRRPGEVARAFLRKPFSLSDLLATVEDLIGRPGADPEGR